MQRRVFYILVDILDTRCYTINIVNNKERKMQKEIEMLEALADKLFAEGRTFLGNQVLEIVYNLEAVAEE